MLVTLSGILILVRLLQPWKACPSMLVTPSPIVMLVRLLQNMKVSRSMLVTLSGIVILFRPTQPEKALSPMLVTLSGIVMPVRRLHAWKADPPILMTLFGRVMLLSLLQPLKARKPILVTPSGIVMLVKLWHLKKASPSMLVTGLPLMVTGMTSSPDTSSSQPVIVTESPCISYFKTEELWLHPPRSRGSVTMIRNKGTGFMGYYFASSTVATGSPLLFQNFSEIFSPSLKLDSIPFCPFSCQATYSPSLLPSL